jgi:hypothetical protein
VKRKCASRVLTILFLALLSTSTIRGVGAIGIHYELDRPYYHPGDEGKLSFTSDEDVMIFGVEMSIHGIGVFKFDMTSIPKDRKIEWGPNNTLAFAWKKGETLRIEFKIPPDTKPSEYAYTWKILWPHEMELAKTDTLRVYAVGGDPSAGAAEPVSSSIDSHPSSTGRLLAGETKE